ncbi:hypothetical protein PHYSODRAFT_412821, partial [Phytophthora sojae]
LLSHGQNVVKSDVDNMVRNHVASLTSTDDNERTAVEVAGFASADADNVVTVDET